MRISTHISCRERNHQHGTALIVVLALLALVLVYFYANSRTLYSLGRELKLLDQRQTQRLQKSSLQRKPPTSQTNSIPVIPEKPGSL